MWDENIFLPLKIINSWPKNELLDVNTTYIDISNWQKFELYPNFERKRKDYFTLVKVAKKENDCGNPRNS